MHIISQIVFLLILAAAVYLFVRNVGRIRRNINLGRPLDMSDRKGERWKTMAMVALGQSKMVVRPVAGFFHILIYAGFVLINIEVLEILIDGALGTHRIFEPLGRIYYIAIGFFEILGLLVLVSCLVFLARRYLLRIKRFTSVELRGFPNKDAATILVVESVLMVALLVMNAADTSLQEAAFMPVTSWLAPLFSGNSQPNNHTIIEIAWWFHYVGILAFLNYLPFSKHFHIILAFPNTYYTRLQPKGQLTNMDSVTTEVKLMMDPSATPPDNYVPPTSFGVKDVKDLTWKNLLDAYTCTECGRCTSVCPANITGKKLSPRKIMMDTRDRLEEVGQQLDKNKGEWTDDGKNLHSYITAEELWACTSCNACVQACPVNINPLEIIVDMRRYLVMEQSTAPAELNNMFTNVENNGAPWQFSPMDRGNWAHDV